MKAKQVRMECECADRNPNMDDPAGSSHWRCVLRYGNRRMTIVFSQGPAVAHEPTVRDVMECVALDAMGFDAARDFEGWCVEYGYDADSRRAERIYCAVERQSKALHRLLGDDFEEVCRRYEDR